MTVLAVSALDLSRLQFATTTLFHFVFVPLTFGLAPLLAIMAIGSSATDAEFY